MFIYGSGNAFMFVLESIISLCSNFKMRGRGGAGGMCVCVCSAELHFSAVTSSDFGKRFRCKIKNPYTVVHVISSTDSIVRLDTNLPTGIIYLQLLKLD